MSNKIFKYKGYYTSIEFDAEELILYGKIEGIKDLISFESDSLNEIENVFHEAVDDYIEYCKECGTNPDKPFKGSFNVRVSEDMHKKIFLEATANDVSINKVVVDALEKYFIDKDNDVIINELVPTMNKMISNLQKSTFVYTYDFERKNQYNLSKPKLNIIDANISS